MSEEGGGGATQSSLPTPRVLRTLASLPASTYPPLRFRPRPPPPDLPRAHLLPVPDAAALHRAAFAPRDALPLQLFLEPGTRTRTETKVAVESAEGFAPERSLFASRTTEADGRAMTDGAESAEAALERLWKPMVKRPGFKSAVVKATKRTGGGLTVAQSLAALKDAAVAHFQLLDSVHAHFTYLTDSALGLDEYEELLTRCRIADDTHKECTLEKCIGIFVATKPKVSKKKAVAKKAAMEAAGVAAAAALEQVGLPASLTPVRSQR